MSACTIAALTATTLTHHEVVGLEARGKLLLAVKSVKKVTKMLNSYPSWNKATKYLDPILSSNFKKIEIYGIKHSQ